MVAFLKNQNTNKQGAEMTVLSRILDVLDFVVIIGLSEICLAVILWFVLFRPFFTTNNKVEKISNRKQTKTSS